MSIIKERCKHLKKRVKKWMYKDIKDFIVFLLGKNPYGEVKVKSGFDWTKIELFVSVLGSLFKDFEITPRKVKANDINDIFQLVYVQPGNLFWARDGNLKAFIMEVDLEKYMFKK